MRNQMEKLTDTQRVIVGVVLVFLIGMSAQIWEPVLRLIAGAVTCLIFLGFVILCVLYKSADQIKKEQQRAEAEHERLAAIQRAQEAQAERERQRQEAKERQAEWERTHGRIITKIAGVTFKNDDGSSRQKYLREIFANGDSGQVSFETYDYQGEPAIHVLFNGMCVGNIPKYDVQEVLDVFDRITHAYLDVTRFTPEDDDDDYDDRPNKRREIIYRADLAIVFSME